MYAATLSPGLPGEISSRSTRFGSSELPLSTPSQAPTNASGQWRHYRFEQKLTRGGRTKPERPRCDCRIPCQQVGAAVLMSLSAMLRKVLPDWERQACQLLMPT